jgi:divalent metal cation (Fe/Co/Zn/Cd) transporter
MRNLSRKIRGAMGNAVTWAVAWFGGSFVAFGALGLLGVVPPIGLGVLVGLALNVGVTGFLAGAGFSLFLGTTYRNRRLEDIRAGSIALRGAAVAALVAPALSTVAVGLGASGIGMGFLAANAIGAAVLGGLTAGGTVALAQRSARQLASSASADESHLLDGQRSALGEGTGGAS